MSDALPETKITQWFADQFGFIHHQISSYDHFIELGIREVIDEYRVTPIYCNDHCYEIHFGDFIFTQPIYKEMDETIHAVTPRTCIDRRMTYDAEFFIDFNVHMPNGVVQVHRHVSLGKIPVMVRSSLCRLSSVRDPREWIKLNEDPDDIGGYFIIDGSAKAMACKEVMIPGYIYKSKDRKSDNYYATIYSPKPNSRKTTIFTLKLYNGQFICNLPYIQQDIPLGLLLKVLTNATPVDILETMTHLVKDRLASSQYEEVVLAVSSMLEVGLDYPTINDALNHIGKIGKTYAMEDDDDFKDHAKQNAIQYARRLIDYELLPHMGTGPTSRDAKLYFIGLMVNNLLPVHFGIVPPESKDHIAYKQIDTPGVIFKSLFADSFKAILGDVQRMVFKSVNSRDFVNIKSIIANRTVTQNFINAFKKNRWELNKAPTPKISQVHDRFNYIANFQSLRKVAKHFSEHSGQSEPPRELHSGSWYALCPANTPEGTSVGLINELAALSTITNGEPPDAIISIIQSMPDVYPISIPPLSGHTQIYVNGSVIGTTMMPYELERLLRGMKRSSAIHPQTSIVYIREDNELHIYTLAGRIIRPVWVLENNQFLVDTFPPPPDDQSVSTFQYYIYNGVIEWLSKIEDEFTLVAASRDQIALYPDVDYAYCESAPHNMFGIAAGSIPFANHNQAPRNAYQCSMGKQSVGIPSINAWTTINTSAYILHYPQKPLAYTAIAEAAGFTKIPSGQNTILFISPMEGFNQEDSVIVNRASAQVGFGTCSILDPYSALIRPDSNERLEIPTIDNCINHYGNTDKLDPATAIIRVGERVTKGDILIGVITTQEEQARSISIKYTQLIDGAVSRVVQQRNKDGYLNIVVVIARYNEYVPSDKMASPHGNKGTVGILCNPEDLPYTARSGVIPDIIINPLAFPSRMTYGMLLESLTGRKLSSSYLHKTPLSAYKMSRDATSFQSNVLDRISKELKLSGINEFGEEMVIDGRTGYAIPTLVFMGIGYYQRLKHMGANKIYSRHQGSRDRLTRQPVEGRANGGGLRIGVMERDNFYANGATYVARDRMMEQSDPSIYCVCKLCGLPAVHVHGNPEYNIQDRGYCNVCKTDKVTYVELPYATKLYFQEASAMGTVPRITPDSAKTLRIDTHHDNDKIVGRGLLMI